MSKWILTVLAAAFGLAIAVTDADAAKRIGGGRSVGTQRNVTTPPPAKAPANASQAAPSQQGAAAPPAAPQSAAGKWGGILGGLALGGLLGYLLGGSGMGGPILLALLAVGAFFLVRALLARRSGESQPAQLAGMAGQSAPLPAGEPAPMQAASYGGQLTGSQQVRVPAGFDAQGFLRGARMNFMKLQLANDRGELAEIKEFTTPEMYEALKGDVLARSGKQDTDIMSVDADLLELVDEDGKYWASVRFSGMEREGAGTAQFEEVWNLVKPTDGSSGWLLAGIQQMH
jgi:predicted lipid-binding transport protein (Tim44 family)